MTVRPHMVSDRPQAVTPPRLAAALLRAATRSEAWREDVLGDIAEEFAGVARASGHAAAIRWYRRQAARLAVHALRARGRAAVRALAILLFIGDKPMSAFSQELSGAIRSLKRKPGVTAAILLTLAIGLGVNAAIFSSIDSLLLKPFNFKDVDQLVMLSEMNATDQFPKESVSPPIFKDIVEHATTLTGVSAYGWSELNLSGGNQPERVAGFTASENFFSTLGVTPQLGRFFVPDSFVWGQHHEVILSDNLWRNRFGADPAVIGRTVHVDSQPAVIVGVAPPRFSFPEGADAWTPLAFAPDVATDYTSRFLTVFGHRAPGRSMSDVASEAASLYTRAAADHPDQLRGFHVDTMTFTHGMVDVGMPSILVLWQAAAAFVLLIGCTNVVNLLLAQGAERQRELAVRLALGASRVRVVRQLLMESLALSIASVPGALAVAWVTLRLMKAAMPPALIRFVPGWEAMRVNLPLMGWTAIAAAVTGLLFGLLPAFQASRSSVLAAVKGSGDGGRSHTAGVGRNRARRALVVAELALALPLLVASAMAVSGVQKFVTGAQGYDPNGLLRASVSLPDAAYKDDAAMRQFADRLMAEIERVPAISSAAVASVLPASGTNRSRDLEIDGRPVDKDHPIGANFRIVTPKYFETMRIPIVNGRTFGTQDRENGEQVAIVSESLAAKYFPGASPVGRRVKIDSVEHGWITIAGVCGDVIDDWFANRNVPTIYVPDAQAPTHFINMVARTQGDPLAVEADVRRVLSAIDPNLPAFSVRTMTDALRERTTGLRFIGGLMAAFGSIALLLAAIGIYSVMAFYVTMRRREMGLRLALGASPGAVLRMTMGQASKLSVIGVVIGTAIALAIARVLEQVLLGTATAGPALFAVVAATLLGVATVASLMPARAATKVDPATTLRE